MAREWLLRGVDPEELKPNGEEKISETPKSKWENFWYHHKWTFWGVLFLVVALGIATVQVFTRDTPDYQVLLMSKSGYVSQQTEALEALLAPYGEDLDGDGKVEVSVQSCLYSSDVSLEYNSGPQMVTAHLAAGDVVFFVWDESAYKMFTGSVQNVSDAGADFLSDIPVAGEGVQEGGKIYSWEDDPRRTGELADWFPEILYFGVRAPVGTASESVTLHDQSLTLLQRFIEGAKTEE